jgi:hypothetical protein
MQTPSLAGPAAEAVERILASTDAAIAAIRSRTELQVRQIAADLEVRAAEEALERRARLEQLHRELAERASALAAAYEALGAQLRALDSARPGIAPSWPTTIRMTLRERRRVALSYDGEATAPTVLHSVRQQPVPDAHPPRRRRWLPWHREAA